MSIPSTARGPFLNSLTRPSASIPCVAAAIRATLDAASRCAAGWRRAAPPSPLRGRRRRDPRGQLVLAAAQLVLHLGHVVVDLPFPGVEPALALGQRGLPVLDRLEPDVHLGADGVLAALDLGLALV